MTHTYTLTGMTCTGCQATVHKLLAAVPGVQQTVIDLAAGTATLTMGHHIPTAALQAALASHPKYALHDLNTQAVPEAPVVAEIRKSWLATYYPLLLLVGFITAVSVLAAYQGGSLSWPLAMRYFMAGFFLCFSFFKLLDLQGFADSYAMYDVVAQRFKPYAYIYPFIELALGLLYVSGFAPFTVNSITAVVMALSLVGVVQSNLNNRKIKCACLGTVFQLPMSTVTIVEDGTMLLMAGYMLLI